MNRGPGGAFERPKRRPTQVLRRLFQYFRPHLWLIVLAVVLSVAGNILSLVSPRLSGAAIDAIIPGNVDFPVVLRYVLLMILCAAASALMSYLLAPADGAPQPQRGLSNAQGSVSAPGRDACQFL